MKNYQDIVRRVNYWLFLVVVALLPFPQVALRYACVLWLISWFLEARWIRKPQCLKTNTMAIPFILFGVWYLWKLLSGLWSPDIAAWRWEMERYMTFGLLIPIGLWGVNTYYNWQQVGKVLVWSCVAAVPLYICWMAFLFFHPDFASSLPLAEPWTQHKEWWVFLSDNISHFKHRLFLCSVELFGLIIAIQLYRKRLALLIPAAIVMISTIQLTGSRQSVLTCAAILVAVIIYALPKRFRLTYGLGILLLGIVIGGGLLKLHPRMQEFDISDITEMREVSYEHDVRFNIWGFALQQPQDYIWYGLGAGQSRQYMLERFEAAHYEGYVMKNYHSHNQYLEEMMEIGVFGMIFFILAWLSMPICARGKGKYTATLFLILFMLNMLTDCMFGKFDGIALWAVGLVFILLQSYTEREKQTTGNA
ncbi:MAG: O-antigen ligase family protein [Paludibacteraceae bacterium]|nr:O-antigen ligase family protein [Paludibacteraceae bacterium]